MLYGLDVIHGYRTIFPVPLAMAASWDPSVHERAAAVAAKEARAAGIHWTFAPMLDIARDARWGRIVEGAGEDPYLGAAMAAAQVRGFQGPYLGAPDRVLACAKHFAAYGAAEGGRDYDPVYVSEGRLRNVYFPPFQAAVAAGVGTFMSAYMDLNDVPAAGNRLLLQDVLRGEWGFKGFVVSDAMAVGNLVIQGFARDGRDAAQQALSAGLDMDMASDTYPEQLPGLVKDGNLTVALVDEAVRPILAVKVRLGLFEHPYADEARAAQVLAAPEHRQEARLAAQRSMVLLRNEGQALPLAKALTNLAVIGPLADSKADTEGSWMVFGHVPAAVTVLEGIRAKLPEATVTHAPGPEIRREIPSFFDDFVPGPKKPAAETPGQAEAAFQKAVETARGADVVVMVLGEAADMSGEAASRASLDLPGRQEELLKAVVALGKPVVLVLLNGRPLSINWAAEHVPAILEAWEPGTRRRERRGRRPLRRREPRRQAAGDLSPKRRPRPPLLRAQPDPSAGGLAEVQVALLGRPADAALSLRLRPELHHVRRLEPEARRAAGESRRDGRRVGRSGEHRRRRRGRGRPALRAPEGGQRLTAPARAEGLPARQPEAGRDGDA